MSNDTKQTLKLLKDLFLLGLIAMFALGMFACALVAADRIRPKSEDIPLIYRTVDQNRLPELWRGI